jgi:hypothetical protein
MPTDDGWVVESAGTEGSMVLGGAWAPFESISGCDATESCEAAGSAMIKTKTLCFVKDDPLLDFDRRDTTSLHSQTFGSLNRQNYRTFSTYNGMCRK